MKTGDLEHIATLIDLRDRTIRAKTHTMKDWVKFVDRNFPLLKDKLL